MGLTLTWIRYIESGPKIGLMVMTNSEHSTKENPEIVLEETN